jgi:2,3,4,5-tetrahydropyridine-2-carboxylate N-succinyltransferase
MSEVFAFAIGHSRVNTHGAMLDCFFPAPWVEPADAQLEAAQLLKTGVSTVMPELAARINEIAADTVLPKALLEHDIPLTAVRLDRDGAVESTAEAYLKLHLLSHRLRRPNTLNLDGIFAHLPNVAWTTAGPVDADELPDALIQARASGRHLEVMSVDKFPKIVNYVIPSGVRIADGSRIRLGAYLGDGTTVMHEGFINFNAGAAGPNMVEGRISQGVFIGEGTDLGGSSSTMGTLSGGGNITISIGKHCLIGANAGTGIPLGDRCTIEAGLYVTSGTLVSVIDESGVRLRTVKARELAGQSDMLLIRNSQTGEVLCRTNRRAIELNETLHSHN